VQPSRSRAAAELLAQLPDATASDHKALGLAFEKSRAYALAADHYREYLALEDIPDSDRLDLELKIGELLYRGGSYYAAVQQLDQIIASDPAPHLKARAEYMAARATYRRGWRRDGRERLREIADRYPGTSSAINSLSLLGDLYESAGNVAAAHEIYIEISEQYPGSRVTPGVRYRLGIVSFLDGDYTEARKYFDRLRQASRWNEMRIKATYWAARARLSEGTPERTAEAEGLFRSVQAHDPFGYYGFLAAERIDIDPWDRLSAGPKPTPIQPETRERFALIALLQQAGLDEEAATVLETIVDAKLRRPEEMLGLSEALAEHGFGQEAVRLGWRAHARLRGVWTESVLRAVYPLAFTEIINAEASSRELDPFLVAAIARQESAFDAGVTSRAGARGLMQLMPATGRWWAGRLGIRDFSIDLLFHPETNVHLGTAYFADLQRRYGELQISLVAYNAGPTRARRWRQRPEYADPELFAERIPLSETRSYVRSVQSHYRIYRHIYGDLRLAQPAD
jgi:soluble lytic murein transglycosylase